MLNNIQSLSQNSVEADAYHGPTVFIYSHSYLSVARSIGLDVDGLIQTLDDGLQNRIVRFPDGAFQIEGPGHADFESAIASIVNQKAFSLAWSATQSAYRNEGKVKRENGRVGGGCFNSLKAYPPLRRYSLITWGDFFLKLDSQIVGVHTEVDDEKGSSREGHIDSTLVSVLFTKRLSNTTRNLFAAQLNSCLDATARQGIAGEGPLLLAQPDLTFYGLLAQFRLDGRRAGQNSINWLILQIIAFADTVPLKHVYFTESLLRGQRFEQLRGYSSADTHTVPVDLVV